jgi:plasmid stability protein
MTISMGAACLPEVLRSITDIDRMIKNDIIDITLSAVHPGGIMANLIVRNLSPRIVAALKQRAARHGRSAEAEHRLLLESVLIHPSRMTFAEAVATLPNVGKDEDFTRKESGKA